MSWYKMSDGSKISKRQIDINVRNAKAKKLSLFLEEHGYYYCEQCGKSNCIPITCAHIESVDSCQKNSRSEKAWDLDNIKLMGIKCHAEYDKNNVQLNFQK